MYIPKPINTDDVVLSEDILELGELISKNTHEVWSQNRINDGWVYGETRDDAQKRHPCLVPYEALPESEKDYDRSTSLQTLKLIVKLGYQITKT
ncbi:MAG: Ryanodine receptor Ryr [Clostridia bacterium]|nr:Ryanodine receptor Ryr [Clostridia bacterium]